MRVRGLALQAQARDPGLPNLAVRRAYVKTRRGLLSTRPLTPRRRIALRSGASLVGLGASEGSAWESRRPVLGEPDGDHDFDHARRHRQMPCRAYRIVDHSPRSWWVCRSLAVESRCWGYKWPPGVCRATTTDATTYKWCNSTHVYRVSTASRSLNTREGE